MLNNHTSKTAIRVGKAHCIFKAANLLSFLFLHIHLTTVSLGNRVVIFCTKVTSFLANSGIGLHPILICLFPTPRPSEHKNKCCASRDKCVRFGSLVEVQPVVQKIKHTNSYTEICLIEISSHLEMNLLTLYFQAY